MTGQADSTAARLVRVITQLDPTTEDKCQARDALMLSLAREAHEQLAPKAADWMYQIHPAAGDNREAESRKALEAEAVAKGVVALIGAPSPQGIGDHDASRALLAGSVARELVSGIIKLDLPPDEKRETRRKLLSLLAGSAGERMHSFGADALVSGLLELATSADEQREASRELLSLLRQETNGHVARLLAIGIVHLATGRTGDKDIRALLDDLINGVTQVALTPEEMRDARQTILGLLDRETNGRTAALLAAAQVFFEPTAEDIRHARQVLLRLLADDTDGPAAQVLVGVIQICPTSEDVRVARQALLRLLTHSTHSQVACEIATGLLQLGPVAEEKRTARQALLRLLTGETDGQLAVRLTLTLEPLDATSHDKHEARQALHQLLIRTASADTTWWARSPDVRDLMTAASAPSDDDDGKAGNPAGRATAAGPRERRRRRRHSFRTRAWTGAPRTDTPGSQRLAHVGDPPEHGTAYLPSGGFLHSMSGLRRCPPSDSFPFESTQHGNRSLARQRSRAYHGALLAQRGCSQLVAPPPCRRPKPPRPPGQ